MAAEESEGLTGWQPERQRQGDFLVQGVPAGGVWDPETAA